MITDATIPDTCSRCGADVRLAYLTERTTTTDGALSIVVEYDGPKRRTALRMWLEWTCWRCLP